MTAAVAAFAESPRAAGQVTAARPILDAAARFLENRRVAEAVRRQSEPGEWCEVGPDDLTSLLDRNSGPPADRRGRLDGPGLVAVLGWLEAADRTRDAWNADDARSRYPGLAEQVAQLPILTTLERRLAGALDPDGGVSDAASPVLKRARGDLVAGERELQQRLERWARSHGESSYVTRHGDRFVALVPAAGFPRRRGIVHDVSASGQSLFVEPLEACESNNRLIELRARVQDEERRILVELANRVLAASEELRILDRILVHLDSLRAKARWASRFGGIALEPGGDRLSLKAAVHPILAMGSRREELVPLDLELGPEERLLLVSGPNMGGKTVLLKTVGLSLALCHSGFPVLAGEGSTMPEVDAVLVDLGDEQSLDQGLSTFAAHLRSLAAMAAEAGPRTFLLCDELGAGTDPEEGASLGRALVEHFSSRGAWGIVTTHLGSLKRMAGDVKGVVNGSLEFDTQTMSPRYRFLPGIPGASHALTMAERLGLDAQVLRRARAITPEESTALERLLQDLQASRRRMDERMADLEKARSRAERAATEHREATEEARRALKDLKGRLTRESEVLLSHARELWQTIQREARRSEKTRAGAMGIRKSVEAVERELEVLQARAEAARAGLGGEAVEAQETFADAPWTLSAGDRVRVIDLGVEAEVVSGPDAEGKVMLRRGSWNINTQVGRLAPVGAAPRGSASEEAPGESRAPEEREGAPGSPSATWEAPDEAPPLELDLRGMDVDEALRSLDRGLDRSVLSGLSELRIIHGVGRGVLRSAVERHLRDHPQVASQRTGQVGEGGRGVTIARLR